MHLFLLSSLQAQQNGKLSASPMEGLQTATFNTPQGNVTVYLPGDVYAGDVISGKVIAEPSGKDESQVKRNSNVLNGTVVELGEDKSPVNDKKGKWNLPGNIVTGITNLILQDKGGEELGRVPLPVSPTPRESFIPEQLSESDFYIPSHTRSGRPTPITGHFDGDFTSSGITINNEEVKLLAESPGKLIFESPRDITGPVDIEIKEGDFVMHETMNLLDVNMQADRLNLMKGEQTIVHLEVEGMQGMDEPVSVGIINLSSNTVKIAGGDRQMLEITPDKISDNGDYNIDLNVSATQTGAFSIYAYVIPPQKEESVEQTETLVAEEVLPPEEIPVEVEEPTTAIADEMPTEEPAVVELSEPEPVKTVNAVGEYGDKVYVEWENPFGENIAGYNVYTSEQPITTIEGLTPAATINNPGRNNTVIDGLALLTQYFISVVPFDAQGNENTDVGSVATVTPVEPKIAIAETGYTDDSLGVVTTVTNGYADPRDVKIELIGDGTPLTTQDYTLGVGDNEILVDIGSLDLANVANLDFAVVDPVNDMSFCTTVDTENTLDTTPDKTKDKKFWDDLWEGILGLLGIIGGIIGLIIASGILAIILAILCLLIGLALFLRFLSKFWTEGGLPYWPWDREFWGLRPKAPKGDPIPLAPKSKAAANPDKPDPDEAEKLTDIAEAESDIAESNTDIAETNAERESETTETNSENAEEEAEKDSTKEAAAEQAERIAEHPPAEGQSELSEANSEVSECNSEASESWSEAAEDPSEYGEAQSEVDERQSEAAEAYSEHGIPPDKRPPFESGA